MNVEKNVCLNCDYEEDIQYKNRREVEGAYFCPKCGSRLNRVKRV